MKVLSLARSYASVGLPQQERKTDVVSLSEATAQLAAFVDRAAMGHDVAITVDGVPVARLTRLEAGKRPIQFGVLRSRLSIPADFDRSLPPNVLDGFAGDCS